jgi:hypothetical protein
VYQRRPAVELRQNRIGLGGIEADDHARNAVISVALEQIEVLLGAPDRDRHRRQVAARFGRHLAELRQQGLHIGILGAGSDPRAAVEERIARGAGRLALPVTAFIPDLETTLARFGEEIIRPYANA